MGQLKELQQKLLKQANVKQDYTEVEDEIYALREECQNVLVAEANGGDEKLLEEQVDIPLEYDEQLVLRVVEKVTVYKEELIVEFKLGLEIPMEI